MIGGTTVFPSTEGIKWEAFTLAVDRLLATYNTMTSQPLAARVVCNEFLPGLAIFVETGSYQFDSLDLFAQLLGPPTLKTRYA